ncbi:MAG: 16S rRNA (adenine(1518)-N(6)/adenine(1519)-N(6))-dimethyltransferase RsmA [Dehalococcoidia bacterium]
MKQKNKRNPKLGQHFLIDQRYKNIIIDNIHNLGIKNILEIGPGAGAITSELVKYSTNFLGIELDKNLYLDLKNKYTDKNVDFLNLDAGKLNTVKYDFFQDKYILAGNLPYYSANMIVRNFITTTFKPNFLIIMIQKEVAENYLSSIPNMKFIGHTIQIYTKVKKIIDVPKEAFNPKPNVNSSIILLETKKDNEIIDQPEKILSFIKKGFSSQRKTLVNSLSLSLKLDKDLLNKELIKVNIDPKLRPGNLEIHDWIKIFNTIIKL